MGSRTKILVLVFWLVTATTSFAATVTYDHRAIVIDGKRRVLISGSIHYPRSTPDVSLIFSFFFFSVFRTRRSSFNYGYVSRLQMWPDLIQKSKDGGLDVIETYVFWNLHEPVRNQVSSFSFFFFLSIFFLVQGKCCSVVGIIPHPN